jgi:riboflavin synthase
VFTGIVEEAGTVRSVERRGDVVVVQVAAGAVLAGMPVGGSIAVDGCCLTAVAVGPGAFACELTGETLRRTAFDERLAPGVRVNLERPLRADGRFDGHIVQGHVDGVGRVRALTRLGASAVLTVEPPASLARYVVEKGSIAVDGVSLTVAELARDAFSVALIPYTLERTNLGDAQPGGRVNLEADVVAKYVERLLAESGRGAR